VRGAYWFASMSCLCGGQEIKSGVLALLERFRMAVFNFLPRGAMGCLWVTGYGSLFADTCLLT